MEPAVGLEPTICCLQDPQSLLTFIQDTQPELLLYVEAAGIAVRDDEGDLRTHWNMCGSIIFPYIANGEIAELRLRCPRAGTKTKSLAGSPELRGATTLMDGRGELQGRPERWSRQPPEVARRRRQFRAASYSPHVHAHLSE